MSVTVLMYHHVLPKSGFITSSIDEFRSQMEFLCKNGYKTLSSKEFYLYKKKQLKVPKKTVLITFDDGWRDNFIYAYPILKEFGLKATIFLVTEWIEKASQESNEFTQSYHNEAKELAKSNPRAVFMNWSEVYEMRDSGLIDFHTHTHSHSDEYFNKFSFEDEVEVSRQIIEQKLNFKDNQLCWPRGIYNNDMIKTAQTFGFEMFYTTQRGVNRADNNLTYIKRVAAKKGATWLKKTLFIYQNDILGSIYSKLKKG